MPSDELTIPVLAGPTASGKSDAAVALGTVALEAWALAAGWGGLELVSADAMMVYRGMDIGTAKPSAAERARVRHHLIDVVDPDEPFSVADYVGRAEAAIADVVARGRLPLVVGGTGFYIRALSQGLPTVPAADPAVQAPLWARVEAEGLEPLHQDLATLSPADAERAQHNPRKVVRALEVLQRTGRPPSNFPFTEPAFRYDKRVLLPPADDLTARIEARTEAMFAAGLVDEVQRLLGHYPHQPTALQAIGYKEVAAYLRGEVSLEGARAQVTLATVRYAKRQRTWFRKEPGAVPIHNVGPAALPDLSAWLRDL
ncbi:MAG: tRNA (adenosine(37)-N6)-dimethylallyltransferase MiaA [Trueperaceae bacterium]|nr:tRNA (adenosine(37)-N6)-dimethylallyltransferase MiaA [Trueperaceae bacterium]